jgi:16S rRNA (cytidine1402-2'-O)-methyltransferase
MAGTLFVVATPIGNLEDITLRALRTLREVQVIAAEDTRRTAKLLTHHGISTPTLSFHEHNTRSRLPQLLARLDEGVNVALVTDAGTPGVSDPGIALVQACIQRAIPVDALPGASAPLVAAVASGFPLEPFTILGFPPYRSKDRSAWFTEASKILHAFSFFEAPHRITQTLQEALPCLGNRPALVARELTKIHQEFVRVDRLNKIIGQMPAIKGEFTIVVGPVPAETQQPMEMPEADIVLEFGRSANNRAGSRRKAIAALAKRSGRTSREVYAIIERAKKSVI